MVVLHNAGVICLTRQEIKQIHWLGERKEPSPQIEQLPSGLRCEAVKVNTQII